MAKLDRKKIILYCIKSFGECQKKFGKNSQTENLAALFLIEKNIMGAVIIKLFNIVVYAFLK